MVKKWLYIALAASFLPLLLPASAYAGVNDFAITNFEIEYQLSKDVEGHSLLKTTETITAEFPSIDQNHGIERAIPQKYDGHGTNLQLQSVTDQNGKARHYDTRQDENGNLVVRIADMSVYVHGTQTYRLTYTQKDVTRFFADTNSDEFYWDTNGVDWRVPINNLHIKLTIDRSLAAAVKSSACYVGKSGSTTKCDLREAGDSYEVSQQNLAVGENVTIALGFSANTFAAYQKTLVEQLIFIWGILQAVLTVCVLGVVALIAKRFNHTINRSRELQPIVPEYLPPQNVSMIVAAKISKTVKGSIMTAQLLDLAIRRYIRLYEQSEKKWYKSSDYEIEIIQDIKPLLAEEQEFLRDMFGHSPLVGERLNLKTLRNNIQYYSRTADDDKNISNLVRKIYDLRAEDKSTKSWLRRLSLIALAVGIISLSPAVIILSAVAFGLSFAAYRLTDKGLALRRYIEGLKMYIEVAEVDRLKMLQSPDGAQKVSQVTNGNTEPRQLVNLYEKVLPYAVLLGKEKEWSKQLGQYYEQSSTQPDWYTSQGVFNAAMFSASMSGFSQAASYTSSSSSSSGGSGGGGSSGGGGGGGGGGGV